MMGTRLKALLPVLLFLLPTAARARECPIAENGRALAVIVYDETRAPRVREAVDELREYVRRMSGAELEVSGSPAEGRPRLHLLTEAQTGAVPGIDSLASLNEEGFIIRVGDDQAWLVGRTELALQHAVYWLLEQWGCRWLFPGEAWEVVPSISRLAVTEAMETDQQPRFLMRDIWYNYGRNLPEMAREDLRLWKRRNRLEYSLTGSIGHAYRRIVPLNDDELFHRQPELFPRLWGHPVQKGQMAMGHPAVEERAVRYAFEYFEKRPQATMVSMSPNDFFGPWRTKDTRHFLFTNAALDLANKVARALKENPQTEDKRVAMYAYLITGLPPTIQAEDNIIIFVATRLNPLPWRWLVSMWSRKAEHLGIQDYASILPWHWTRPTWKLGALERKVTFWDRKGIIGVNVESGNDWGGWGLYHYVMARLMWNPGEKAEEIFENFIQKGFAGAEREMERYFKRWKLGYSTHTLELATRDLAAALDRNPSREHGRRIELLALYLHHLHLHERRRRELPGDRPKEILRETVEFDWRLATTSMAHSQALIEEFIRGGAIRRYRLSEGEFDSWKRNEPFTSNEARQYLADDLRRTYD